MRTLTLIAVLLGGLTWFAHDAAAADRNVFQLPQQTVTARADGSTAIEVTPVRTGWGWRGPGYYPGWYRPYYGGGYRGGYYGNYYRGGYGYGNYYQPYYNSYRPYYGGGYYWR